MDRRRRVQPDDGAAPHSSRRLLVPLHRVDDDRDEIPQRELVTVRHGDVDHPGKIPVGFLNRAAVEDLPREFGRLDLKVLDFDLQRLGGQLPLTKPRPQRRPVPAT
ncbi:MAG TPA: hypothetical protein VMT17_06315 [Anaeromyxobacteraceae bacterium]|nr:hypothetical protein [Anaeromyxobacteraceae bacterium]